MTNTVRLHRVLAAPPERVYRAFVEPEALTKWLPPHGFVGKMHSMEAKVGGAFSMSFTNFSNKTSQSFGGTYLEMEPGKRLKYTDHFDDPAMPGELTVSVTFTPVSCGTDLNVVQEGIPDMIPVELCYLGWQQSLEALANVVEPEIP